MSGRALDARELAWLELARCVTRPASARLDAARAALAPYGADAMDPREAWEALVAREVVAEAWALRGPRDVSRLGAQGPAAHAESVAAVAADPEGVAAVEALVAELVTRLHPWTELSPAQVRWVTVPVDATQFPIPAPFAASPAFSCIEALYASTAWGSKEDGALHRSVERAFRPVSGRPSGTVSLAKPPRREGDPAWYARVWDRASAGQHAIYHVTNRALWEACVALDLKSERCDDRPFRAMLDPAEVLLHIWSLGYVVGEMRDDDVVVYAPERGANRDAPSSV